MEDIGLPEGAVPTERFILRNNIAIVVWIFGAIWIGMLFLFTWLFIRDGGFHQFDPPIETAIMLIFWVFGFACYQHVASLSRTSLIVENGRVTVSERWPFHGHTEQFDPDEIGAPILETGRDSEGDPYFCCVLTTPAGHAVSVAEGNDRETVEAARQKLLMALTGKNA